MSGRNSFSSPDRKRNGLCIKESQLEYIIGMREWFYFLTENKADGEF